MTHFSRTLLAALGALALLAAPACNKKAPDVAPPAAPAATPDKAAAPAPDKAAAPASDKPAEPAPATGATEAATAATAPALAGGQLASLMTTVETRVDEALARPGVNKALDDLFTGLAGDPEFAAAGQAVLTSMGEAPAVAQAGGAIVQTLATSPEIAKYVQAQMAANPGMDPSALEGKLTGRVEAAFEGDAWDKGFDKAFDKFAQDPTVDAAFTRFGEVLSQDAKLDQALEGYFTKKLTDAKVQARLTELNGGTAPDAAKLPELLLAQVLTTDKLEKFLTSFFTMAPLKKEIAAALLPFLKSETFKKSVGERVGKILADPAFQPLAVKFMVDLITGPDATAESIESGIAPLLGLPVVRDQVAGLVNDITSNPELKGPLAAAFANAAKDPAFEAALDAAFLQ